MSAIIVKFKGWVCDLVFDWYTVNGRLSIDLIDLEDGQPIAHATVNIPDYDLPPDEVIIKDYSENEGMLAALVKIGIVKPTGKRIQTGFVYCPICKINMLMLPRDVADKVKEDCECWYEIKVEAENEVGN
jgi:hypothetical protein